MNLRNGAGKFPHFVESPDRPPRVFLTSRGGRLFLALAAGLLCLTSIAACNKVPSSACGSHIPHGMRVYAKHVMDYLGAPHSHANLASFNCWANLENTDAGWNPLATTLDAPGADCANPTSDGSTCVRDYPDELTGAKATADTIAGYSDLDSAFRSGNGVCGGWYGGSFGSWSGGGYSSVCSIIFLPFWLRRRRR